MKYFWWTASGSLYRMNISPDSTSVWPTCASPYELRSLLPAGYVEISQQTAREMGWPT